MRPPHCSRSLALICCGIAADAPVSGTQILKWKDGKKAAFLLAFDDGCPSQLTNVVPELEKRKIVGTFYLVTGNSLYANLKSKWEASAKSPYIVVANHTFTHRGVNNADGLDPELAKCNEVIYQMHADRKQPRLLGFGKPGGVPWEVSQEELDSALQNTTSLIVRPFTVLQSITSRPQKWWVSSMPHSRKAKWATWISMVSAETGSQHRLDWFAALIEKLEKSRDQLWITDLVSWHQYTAERKGAIVKVLRNDQSGIRLELTSTADPMLYNHPLTLTTKVPAEWNDCVVEQGATKVTVSASGGVVRYDAVPGAGEIRIQPTASPNR